ncbi:D-serine ammonia-lyase [Virgibacillus profundi]|uniref:Probable D-serine dehydratase n=1 Tax=Virgibacillus profundi TaxID=2024555 RepID=A0A2A2IDK5_9BACI|nr:D-serine ammonia-lyase [Virgibacillus profundi]PAV29406.1 D-serine ammonia-lyase [Virgibacillus profundi]PXY53576.1 D-serine ammonia-lyase [Virgibacillus profundi]
MAFTEKEIDNYKQSFPLLEEIMDLEPTVWLNPDLKEAQVTPELPLTKEDMIEAEKLWIRFAPFLKKALPKLNHTNGIIESPLKNISKMKEVLEANYHSKINGNLYLKCDNELPVAGSIKARGGFYEVLHYAESLAIDAGLINREENYEAFQIESFKEFFQQYSIGVGSTGNLGLSIGIMSAKLGFNVSVYMSRDAKQWKKDLLREKGAKVFEFDGDFSVAIDTGRKQTLADPKGYFVDDESSKHLFLGYSTAAFELEEQLKKQDIKVDKDNPLFVYLPCGVGGSPGGITFGLKQLFGDNVHCFFVEPTHSPSVLIGLLTGKMNKVSVQDFGIDNLTAADGLAVGRPSSFATSISKHLISGIYTMEDDELYKLLALLYDYEDINVEPSATAGIIGPQRISKTNYTAQALENATHIAWSTGGALVPEVDMKQFYEKGKQILETKNI